MIHVTSHAERILDRVSRGCSLNRVFVSGEDAAALADLLRLRGAIVEESRASTIAEVIDDLRAASTSFSLAIVCISAPDLGDEDARYLCAALRRATSTAYLRITAGTNPGHLEDIGSRPWWERHAVASGFRRHPSVAHLVAYEQLDSRGITPWLLIEAVPQRSESPLDELRQITADADAAIWRYARAAHFVRRHDRVLDLDCGVGAGTAIVGPAALAASVVGFVRDQAALQYAKAHYGSGRGAVEFRVAQPTDISQCPDESIDVVLSCRPLPSTFWTADVIDEIRRVLTPGGRLICCVTEEDLAVRYQIAGGLLLEHVLGQSGARSESELPRWREVQIDNPHERPGVDWWFFVAMKDPLSGTAATYQERLYPHTAFPVAPTPRDTSVPSRIPGCTRASSPSAPASHAERCWSNSVATSFEKARTRRMRQARIACSAISFSRRRGPSPISSECGSVRLTHACVRYSTTSRQPCNGVSCCSSLPVVWRCGTRITRRRSDRFKPACLRTRHDSRRYLRRRRSKRRIGQGCCARAAATATRPGDRGHVASRSRRAVSGLKPNRHAI